MKPMLLSCPNCRAALRLNGPVPAGKTPRCPKCGSAVPLSDVAPEESGSKPPSHDTDNGLHDDAPHKDTAASVKLTPDSGKHLRTAPHAFLAPPKLPGELGRLGPYRILSEIGVGGMGMVFRAEDLLLKRHIALKVMLPQFAVNESAKQRFLREARVAAQVENDHVVPIFQVNEDNGTPYLAMPLLKGETLTDYLKRTPLVPWPEVVRIGREMAEGLAAAHEKRLIHRDIKPGNVWLEGERRRVKILDFGLARPETGYEDESFASGMSNLANEGNAITQVGMIVGTPAYMSPEQARGRSVDARTDLFSLGIVLYQMITGRMPFQGPTTMALLTALAVDNPVPPADLIADVPPELNALILQLLAKDPNHRPASAAAVADFLRQLEATTLALTAGSTATPMPQHNPWAQIDSAWGETVITPAPFAATPEPRSAIRPRRRKSHPLVPWIMLAALVIGTIGLLAVFAAAVTAPTKGTLVIEGEDADAEITVKKDGEVVLDRTRERRIRLDAGAYTVELSHESDSLRLSRSSVVIPEQGEEVVRILKVETPRSPPKPPVKTSRQPPPTSRSR